MPQYPTKAKGPPAFFFFFELLYLVRLRLSEGTARLCGKIFFREGEFLTAGSKKSKKLRYERMNRFSFLYLLCLVRLKPSENGQPDFAVKSSLKNNSKKKGKRSGYTPPRTSAVFKPF
jgi:hypothetical protein